MPAGVRPSIAGPQPPQGDAVPSSPQPGWPGRPRAAQAALGRFGTVAMAIAVALAWAMPIADAVGRDAADPAVAEPRLAAEMADRINRLRAQAYDCGDPLRVASAGPLTLPAPPERPALRPAAALSRAALRQARTIAATSHVAHRAPDGTTVRERARDAGYAWRIIGENLAAGQPDVAAVVAQWFASASHCDNLLDPRFTEFGIARIVAADPADPYRTYWALVLGSPREGPSPGAAPLPRPARRTR